MTSYKNHLILTGCTIRQALIQLTQLGINAIIFVVDEENKLIGSITDGDIRRGLIKGALLDDPINTIIRAIPRFIKKGERDIQKVIQYREENFQIIPILDIENHVVNVINFRQIRSYLPVDAVIMAGGKGQRLYPLTEKKPKPLLKVGNKPIMERNIERLLLFGIDDVWITVNYLGEQIEKYFGDGSDRNINITYVHEVLPQGTIGSISKIQNFQHDYVLITNSDLLTNIDYEHFFIEFLKEDADLAVVTIPYLVNIPYAVIETKNSQVVSFKEKPTYTYYSNAGIYFVKRTALELIPKNTHFNATDLIELLITQKKKVFSYPFLGYWLDIGNPEDFEKAQQDIKSIKF